MFEKTRLEAFSDGVIAVIITIMVLDLKVETGSEDGWAEIGSKADTFIAYTISFFLVACLWIGHHHTLSMAKYSTSAMIWMNFLFLFFLSLIPFATSFIQQHPNTHESSAPGTFFSIVIAFTGMARTALLGLVVRQYKDEDPFPQAVRNSWRTKAIPALFALSISGSYLHIWAGRGFLLIIIFIWGYPDKRVEDALEAMAASKEEIHSRARDHSMVTFLRTNSTSSSAPSTDETGTYTAPLLPASTL